VGGDIVDLGDQRSRKMNQDVSPHQDVGPRADAPIREDVGLRDIGFAFTGLGICAAVAILLMLFS
jgi:hypothetical protein